MLFRSTGVALGAAVSATFSEAIDVATLSTTTFVVTTPASAVVSGSVAYNAATKTATFTPSAPLVASTGYTVTLKGGATEPRVKDLAGNALVANVAWTFTTGTAGGGCTAPANAVVAENCLTGNPASEWDVSGVATRRSRAT